MEKVVDLADAQTALETVQRYLWVVQILQVCLNSKDFGDATANGSTEKFSIIKHRWPKELHAPC